MMMIIYNQPTDFLESLWNNSENSAWHYSFEQHNLVAIKNNQTKKNIYIDFFFKAESDKSGIF